MAEPQTLEEVLMIRGLASVLQSRLRAKAMFINQELVTLESLAKDFDLAVTNVHITDSEILREDLYRVVDELKSECDLVSKYLDHRPIGGDE